MEETRARFWQTITTFFSRSTAETRCRRSARGMNENTKGQAQTPSIVNASFFEATIAVTASYGYSSMESLLSNVGRGIDMIFFR